MEIPTTSALSIVKRNGPVAVKDRPFLMAKIMSAITVCHKGHKRKKKQNIGLAVASDNFTNITTDLLS